MWLLIDAGNTRIKWAVSDLQHELASSNAVAWLCSGALTHAELDAETAKKMSAPLQAVQQAVKQTERLSALPETLQSYPVQQILFSNVAGTVVQGQIEQLVSQLFPQAQVTQFKSSEQCAGVKNGYRNPLQLGSDRFASVIGAHALHPDRNLIVATCGTATTVDAVLGNGIFLGGMILPGLKLMAQSLSQNTAQLPEVAANLQCASLFADNTQAAIVSGCLHAQAGAIIEAHNALQLQFDAPVNCIISGGASTYIQPYISISCQSVENLVLTGLFVVAKFISSEKPL